MVTMLPESVDPWQMVRIRRTFEGSLPLASMRRLADMLAGTQGTVDYVLDFGRDDVGTTYLDVHAVTSLELICQRTLEPFLLPVAIDQRLGLVTDDSAWNRLPPDCEPLLVQDDRINPLEALEDELLLAVPAIPVSPDSHWPEGGVDSTEPEGPAEIRKDNPFAVLRELKRK